MDIEARQYWLHKDTKRLVMVVDTCVKTKDGGESAWSNGVGFKLDDSTEIGADPDEPDIMYVVKVTDFLDKFERPPVMDEDA